MVAQLQPVLLNYLARRRHPEPPGGAAAGEAPVPLEPGASLYQFYNYQQALQSSFPLSHPSPKWNIYGLVRVVCNSTATARQQHGSNSTAAAAAGDDGSCRNLFSGGSFDRGTAVTMRSLRVRRCRGPGSPPFPPVSTALELDVRGSAQCTGRRGPPSPIHARQVSVWHRAQGAAVSDLRSHGLSLGC